jgi:pantetheine-phosphate adenylyltransferase
MTPSDKHVCVFPGSFDPITLGHIDIIRRARRLYDGVIVVILRNESKQGLFPLAQRKQIALEALSDMPDVQVETFGGLLADFLGYTDTHIILRGLRTGIEFDAEHHNALLNRMLAPGTETVFLPASPDISHISSSAAKEITSLGGDASSLLPAASWEALKKAAQRQ